MRHPHLARWSAGLTGLAAALLLVSFSAVPAQAITNGDLDGEGHPFVGLMISKDAAGNPFGVCTGTLLSPTVFLTAGHCTAEPAVSAEVWFDPDLTDAAANGLPDTGESHGTTYTHPEYDPAHFTTRDVGVVLLDTPVDMPEYGTLPALNAFDAWTTQRGLQDTGFTTIGYGVQRMFPDAASWKIEYQRLRMVATPRLVQINTPSTGDFSLLLSANARTGGQCFGDSGGPSFVGTSTVVGAVTSYGSNDLCKGTSGAFRMDRSWALDWVQSFLPSS